MGNGSTRDSSKGEITRNSKDPLSDAVSVAGRRARENSISSNLTLQLNLSSVKRSSQSSPRSGSPRSAKCGISLVLLGPSEDDKSTFFQRFHYEAETMRLKRLYGDAKIEVHPEEHTLFRQQLWKQIRFDLRAVVVACREAKQQLDSPTNEALADWILTPASEEHSLSTDEHVVATNHLWSDSSIIKMHSEVTKLYPRRISIFSNYLLDNHQKFFQPHYVPTLYDLSQCKVQAEWEAATSDMLWEGILWNLVYSPLGSTSLLDRKRLHRESKLQVLIIVYFVPLHTYCEPDIINPESTGLDTILNEFKVFIQSRIHKKIKLVMVYSEMDKFDSAIRKHVDPRLHGYDDYECSFDVEESRAYFKSKFAKCIPVDTLTMEFESKSGSTDAFSPILADAKEYANAMLNEDDISNISN